MHPTRLQPSCSWGRVLPALSMSSLYVTWLAIFVRKKKKKTTKTSIIKKKKKSKLLVFSRLASFDEQHSSISIIWLSPGGFPSGSVIKESDCYAGDPGLIPGSGSSPGEGNGNPLQYFCLEHPMERGTSQARVHGVKKSQTRLSD